jgi:hypothetical protein
MTIRFCGTLGLSFVLTGIAGAAVAGTDDDEWGDARFDCSVFLFKPDRAEFLTAELSAELVRANVEWVEVAGIGSEAVHEAIDAASVACGRQAAVGDGSPMTTWNEESRSPKQMADDVFLGAEDWLLVLAVGNNADLHAAVAAVRQRVERVDE